MGKFIVGALTAFFFLGLFNIAESDARGNNFDLGYGFGSNEIAGTIRYEGEDLSLKNTLGMKKGTYSPIKFKWDHQNRVLPDISYRYLPMSFSGENNTVAALQYGGTIYDAATRINSAITLDRHDMTFIYNIISRDRVKRGGTDFELGINMKILKMSATLGGTVNGVSGTEVHKAVTIHVPQLYFGFKASPSKYFSAGAELFYVGYESSSIIDFFFELKIKPYKGYYVSVGYFQESFKADTNDVSASISIYAPAIMIGAEF